MKIAGCGPDTNGIEPPPLTAHCWRLSAKPRGIQVLSIGKQEKAKSRSIANWLLTALISSCALVAKADELELELEFVEAAPGIYLHIGKHQAMSVDNLGDIANIGFIIGTDSVAVIDPGGSPRVGRAMRAAIHAQTDLPISHVILTHVHPDHIFGAGAFAGAQLVAHRNFARAIAQRGNYYIDRYKSLFTESDVSLSLQPTVTVTDELQVELGGRTLLLRAHQTAHTDNDLSVFDIATRTLWASDLIFAQRIPSLDGSLTGWLKVMDDLAALQADLVIPGHGLPGAWSTVAPPQRRYLTLLLQETRLFIAQNKRLADAIESVAVAERQHWQLFDEQHPGNVTRAFTELEWE